MFFDTKCVLTRWLYSMIFIYGIWWLAVPTLSFSCASALRERNFDLPSYSLIWQKALNWCHCRHRGSTCAFFDISISKKFLIEHLSDLTMLQKCIFPYFRIFNRTWKRHFYLTVLPDSVDTLIIKCKRVEHPSHHLGRRRMIRLEYKTYDRLCSKQAGETCPQKP